MNQLVLSLTKPHVLSMTRSSCYRQPKFIITFCFEKACGAPNLSNLDSFGILLTNPAFYHIVNKRTAGAIDRARTVAVLDQNKSVSNFKHIPYEQTPKRSRVPPVEAASLSRALVEVGPEREEGLAEVLRLCWFRLPGAPSRDVKIHRHPLSQGDRRSVTRLSAHAIDSQMTETARSQQKTFTKAQSFAVQMIIRHSIAPRGCINFTAIWQTLAVLMMLPVIARELSRKNRK